MPGAAGPFFFFRFFRTLAYRSPNVGFVQRRALRYDISALPAEQRAFHHTLNGSECIYNTRHTMYSCEMAAERGPGRLATQGFAFIRHYLEVHRLSSSLRERAIHIHHRADEHACAQGTHWGATFSIWHFCRAEKRGK